MRKKFIQIALLLSSVFTSFNANASDDIVVCGVPQVYSAVMSIKNFSPVKYDTYFGTQEDIEERVLSNSGTCTLILTDEEKLPVSLLRANKTSVDAVKQFIKAPLILWTKNKRLLIDDVRPIVKKKLKSIALPKPELTSVGYSASEVSKMKNFPTEYLKKNNKIYRPNSEFQAYVLARSGKVQTAFVTKPLIMRNGRPTGSYWFIPHDYYSPIYYYIISTENSKRAKELFDYLSTNSDALQYFYRSGFEDLAKR